MFGEKVKPSPKPKATTVKVAPGSKINMKPTSKPTLPTLSEYKQSAAYKTGAMSYKDYLDYFKSRGAK